MTKPEKKEKKKRGRPPGSGLAITPEKADKIMTVLELGGSRNDAADYVGVGRGTLSAHVQRDEDFAERLKMAEAKGKVYHLNKISKSPSWQASAWMLERKYWQEFGKPEFRKRDDDSVVAAQIVIVRPKAKQNGD